MSNETAPSAATPILARDRFLRMFRFAAPYLFGVLFLIGWQAVVVIDDIQPFLLPSPVLIAKTLVKSFIDLLPNWLVTITITVEAFLVSAVVGLILSMLMTSARWIERTLYPYAVIMQVTPIVAIAPLIIIWTKQNTSLALLICAWLVAFFPVVSNATVGLNSTDRNLVDLFKLYGANRTQTLFWLRLPGSMPFYLAGLRIAGGLGLIGAIVAEFVAGTGGAKSGLAYRIIESSYRLDIPKMFAALVLISLTGIAIFFILSLFTRFMLRHWHESAQR